MVRIYTGEDGRSHFEDLEIPASQFYGNERTQSLILPATGLLFRDVPPGDVGFHNPPRRQFNFVLSGRLQIECGDGTAREFGPGDVFLADDTTGEGHITRELGGARRSAFVIVPPDLDVTQWRVDQT